MRRRTPVLTVLLVLPLLQACSPAPAPPAAARPPAPASTPTPVAPVASVVVPGGPQRACNRLTDAELSVIVGTPMQATPHDETEGITSCFYAPVAGDGPSVQYTISAGDGPSTLRMGREMKNYDPGPGKAYAGIGEDADIIGPAIVINDHGDMVSLYLGGIGLEAQPALAKKIYDASQEAP